MPELPEVETTRRGLEPHLVDRRIHGVILRRPDLRWPIPAEIEQQLPGQRIEAIRRRAKYLLLDTEAGSAVLHLGMSGSLRVLPGDTPVRAHDHVDISLEDGRLLRFNDPRRLARRMNCCAILAPNRWMRTSMATTCSSAAVAARRRSRPS